MSNDVLKCPSCEFIGKNITSLGTHAAMKHKISGEQLFLIRSGLDAPPTCRCGCGSPVRYISLTKGYSTFVQNHGDVEFYQNRGAKIAKAKALKSSEEMSAATKEKISIARKKGFANGTIVSWNDKRFNPNAVSWNKGQSKETDERISAYGKKCSEILKKKFKNKEIKVWCTLTPEEVNKRIQLQTDFEFLDDAERYETLFSPKFRFRHRKCGIEQQMSLLQLQQKMLCAFCEHGNISKGQKELFEFVRNLCPDAILNDRSTIKPRELDILIPSKRVAIEFNGIYYHSSARENFDKNSHVQKQELCQAANIKLFQVFEDEWIKKREIVESMITHRLGMTKKRIYARSCQVREIIERDLIHDFLSVSHIEGVGGRFRVAFGLFFNDKLVAALTLREPYSNRYVGFSEIARFATLSNTHVVGGLGKLVKSAIIWAKQAGKIGLITYLDQRFGSKVMYENVGFQFQHETPPRFWWVSFSEMKRYSRQKFRAKDGKSEAEVASEAGVFRIYGCRNSLFKIKFNKNED